MRRFAPCLPLLALVGCAGSVTLEDVDAFGGAASAVWFHWDDSDYDSIVLSNVSGLCAKTQAVAEAQAEYLDEVEDIDESDWCEDAKEPFFKLARTSDALYHEGAHSLTLTVFGDATTVPDEGSYEVLDLTALLYGQMTYYDNSPYADAMAEWDTSADYNDNCGVTDAELEGTTWILSDGTLDLETVDDEKRLSGTLEGELVDDDADNAGDIDAKFSATWCEVDQ